jgi:hypothetical protein
VAFRYKHDLDPDGIPQFGLVAEDVEKVNPDPVSEFLKEHRKNEKQEATITALRANAAKQEATIEQLKNDFEVTVAPQQKQIEALTGGLQKVSVQVEASRFAPQTVVKNQ